MANSWAFIFVLALSSCVTGSSARECRNAATSEGRVTLQHGQTACAPLSVGESEATDKGKKFVTCSSGNLLTQPCPSGLRFDSRGGVCIWRQLASCRLPESLSTQSPTRSTTISTPRTTTLDNKLSTTQYTTQSNINTTTQIPIDLSKNTTTKYSTNSSTYTTIYPSTNSQINTIALDTTETWSTSTYSQNSNSNINTTESIILSKTDITQTTTETILSSSSAYTTASANSEFNTIYPTLSLSPDSIIKLVPAVQTTTTTPLSIPDAATYSLPAINATTNALPEIYATEYSPPSTKIATSTPVIDATTAALLLGIDATPYLLSQIELATISAIDATSTLQPTIDTTIYTLQSSTETTTNTLQFAINAATTTPSIEGTATSQSAIDATTSTPLLAKLESTTLLPAPSTKAVAPSITESQGSTTSYISINQDSTTNSSSPSNSQSNTITPTTTPPIFFTDICSTDNCKPPNCSCYGARPNMSLEDTPLFVTISFSGAISPALYNSILKDLLVDNSNKLNNPSGCPLRTTMFLTDEGTDYTLVRALSEAGHEIASHTLTKSLPMGYSSLDYNETVTEIDGLRKRVLQESRSKELHDSIVGFRAPNLRIANNVQYDVLQNYNFLYDSSYSSAEIYAHRSPIWPFTLDYLIDECPFPPCTTKVHPGMWQVPINAMLGRDGNSCSYIDECNVGTNVFTADEQAWFSFYKANLEKYFYPVKVPMQVSLRDSTLSRNNPSFPAMVRWLQDLLSSRQDVWLATSKMVIDWMRSPLTNSQMIDQRWGC